MFSDDQWLQMLHNINRRTRVESAIVELVSSSNFIKFHSNVLQIDDKGYPYHSTLSEYAKFLDSSLHEIQYLILLEHGNNSLFASVIKSELNSLSRMTDYTKLDYISTYKSSQICKRLHLVLRKKSNLQNYDVANIRYVITKLSGNLYHNALDMLIEVRKMEKYITLPDLTRYEDETVFD